MNRLVSFAAGMVTAAAFAAVSGARIHAAVFALGFTVAALLVLAYLSSAGRLHQAAARLEHLALWIDAKPPAHRPPPPELLVSARERELVSALMNLGSRRPAARAAARYAIANNPPAANIPDLVRTALRAPQVAA